MTALPDNWTVQAEPIPEPGQVHPRYPLASKGGIDALSNILSADLVWRALTKPQRELLLSTAAGYPIAARADVRWRLIDRGLLAAVSESGYQLTAAGRLVVQWRPS